MAIKISHEIPKTLFRRHDDISDYPYVLGHLLKLDKEYADFYKNKLKFATYSILDNSAFELGSSIPMEELYELGKEYKATHLVLPDVVNNYSKTLANAEIYLDKFYDSNQKYIGVCQGDTFEDIVDCIEFYVSTGKVAIIALPFDLIENTDYVTARYRFFNWFVDTYPEKFYTTINAGIQFHLLGCQNPVEFILINSLPAKIKNRICSVDTSSPVVNGWLGHLLDPMHGLIQPKPKAKLADNLDIELDNKQLALIFKNVQTFKNYFQ